MHRPALDPGQLRAAVAGAWRRIEVVEQTASTNADLLADAAAPDRSVLVAEYQSAGRGRFERAWTSPPRAGLTFSVLLRPAVDRTRWGWLPLLAGVALAEAVQDVCGVPAALKWPNDLLLGPRHGKAAGILVQSGVQSGVRSGVRSGAAQGDAHGDGYIAVVGIGLNVSATADELPSGAATSLALQQARTLERVPILAAVLARLDDRLAAWSDAGGDANAAALAGAYRARCATIGTAVRVERRGGEALEGRAVTVDDEGRLVVQDARGRAHAISAGDVQHLRPDTPPEAGRD